LNFGTDGTASGGDSFSFLTRTPDRPFASGRGGSGYDGLPEPVAACDSIALTLAGGQVRSAQQHADVVRRPEPSPPLSAPAGLAGTQWQFAYNNAATPWSAWNRLE
jgi:hypothetical protein